MSASKLPKNVFFSGDFNTFPFVSVVYFSAVRLITFMGSLTIQHTAVHVFHSLLINSCFDRILPLYSDDESELDSKYITALRLSRCCLDLYLKSQQC